MLHDNVIGMGVMAEGMNASKPYQLGQSALLHQIWCTCFSLYKRPSVLAARVQAGRSLLRLMERCHWQVAVPELSGSVKRTMGRWLSTSRVTSLYRLAQIPSASAHASGHGKPAA